MTGVVHVAGYLVALADALPSTRPYTLQAVELGSDVQGWTLALRLNVPGLEPIFLEGDDLEKPIEQLVRETIDTIHRAAEVRRRQAEFDRMTGSNA